MELLVWLGRAEAVTLQQVVRPSDTVHPVASPGELQHHMGDGTRAPLICDPSDWSQEQWSAHVAAVLAAPLTGLVVVSAPSETASRLVGSASAVHRVRMVVRKGLNVAVDLCETIDDFRQGSADEAVVAALRQVLTNIPRSLAEALLAVFSVPARKSATLLAKMAGRSPRSVSRRLTAARLPSARFFLRAARVVQAYDRLRISVGIDEAALGAGYPSGEQLRLDVQRVLGIPPSQLRALAEDELVARLLRVLVPTTTLPASEREMYSSRRAIGSFRWASRSR